VIGNSNVKAWKTKIIFPLQVANQITATVALTGYQVAEEL